MCKFQCGQSLPLLLDEAERKKKQFNNSDRGEIAVDQNSERRCTFPGASGTGHGILSDEQLILRKNAAIMLYKWEQQKEHVLAEAIQPRQRPL